MKVSAGLVPAEGREEGLFQALQLRGLLTVWFPGS